jgi:hypothetical protein
MGGNEKLGKKTTLKLGGGRGMSDTYIFTKKGQMKGRNSYEQRENQRGLIVTKATLSPS